MPPRQPVLVILTAAAPPPGLTRAAVRNGWPILRGPTSPHQLRCELSSAESSVVIVHIPGSCQTALGTIRMARTLRSTALVLAVGLAGSEEDEIQARAAGAGLFLPDTADAVLVERTVRLLIGQPQTQPAEPSIARARARSVG